MDSDLPDNERLLAEGVAALRAGERVRARNLLISVVHANPRSADAWLWLSGTFDDPSQQRECLQRVLKIEPENVAAQRGLAALQTPLQPEAALPPPPPTTASAYLPLPSLPIALLLSVLGGSGVVLSWMAQRSVVTDAEPRAILLVAILSGPPLMVLALIGLGVLLRLSGRSLGGYGTTSNVVTGLSLAAIPQTISLVLWLIQLVFIPSASFGGTGVTSSQALIANGLRIVHLLLDAASIYLAIAGIAAAHQVSFARSIATWLLAMLFVLMTMITIFASSALLITLRGG